MFRRLSSLHQYNTCELHAENEVSCDSGATGSTIRFFRVKLGRSVVARTIEVQFRVGLVPQLFVEDL